MNNSGVILGKSESYTLSAHANSGAYCNPVDIKWSTSNSNVVKVTKGSSNKATIKGVGKGTANVTVTLYNGLKYSCKVTVK